MTGERNPHNRMNTGASRGGARPAANRPRRPRRPRRPGGAQDRRTAAPRAGARGNARPGARTATRTRGGAPARRQAPARRAKKPFRGWRSIPPKARLAVCAVALLAVLFGLGTGIVRVVNNVRESQIERFVDNVFVNGVCLSGYTYDEGVELLTQMREERLNANYTLTDGEKTWTFSPAAFNAALDYESEIERAWNLGHVGDRATRRQIINNLKEVPAEFNCELTYDAAALDAYIGELASEIHVDPVDAEVAVTETKPVIITASKNGRELDQERTRENLVALLETGEGDTRLPVEDVQPTITSDNMEMKVVAKFSTDVSFRGADSRSNVRQALSYFNGYVVYPGDTADFNEIVGPRTVGRGFKEAPEYAGNELKKGVGGGVCQASTTLYNAAIMANMTILQRSNHNMTVSYVEPSQDAAVEYGVDGKDFIFRNDTEHAIYIYTDVDRENATVTIYGTRPEYHYVLESVIIDESKSDRKRYEYDMSGKYVYYITDKPKLKTAGHGSCHSEGWVVAYDWDTKQEVSREQISYDVYVAGMNVYWRGVHDENGNVVDPNQPKAEAEG